MEGREQELRRHWLANKTAIFEELEWVLPVYRNINAKVVPNRGRYLSRQEQTNTARRSGRAKKRHTQRMSDIQSSAAVYAHRTFASGMMAGSSSPARPWFRYSTGEDELDERADVSKWLHDTTRLLLRICREANFYGQLRTAYGDLGGFGNTCMYSYPNFENVAWFYTAEPGECAYVLGPDLSLDGVYRRDHMSTMQLVRKFGERNCSESVQRLWREKKYHDVHPVLHIVEPRPIHNYGALPNTQLPWVEVYLEEAAQDNNAGLLQERGFHEKPFAAPRWEPGNEVYSMGAGHYVLGDVGELMTARKRSGQILEAIARPPLKAPESYRTNMRSVLPGGVTYGDPGPGNDGLTPVYQINNAQALQAVENRIAQLTADIREGFFADLFQMLTLSDRRMMTATEVAERHEEKLLMLGPVIESVHTDLLAPMIERMFNMAMRAGLLPPPPQELENRDIQPKFTSLLAQAQELVALGPIERLAGMAGTVGQLDPKAIKRIKGDKMVMEAGRILGVDPDLLATDEEIEEQVAAEQQAMQAQQATEAMPAMVDAASALNEQAGGAPANNIQTALGV